tara:strand:+ start:6976 stop:7347 length:372 start_codon:yes stop_codon:yes gene_type:complete
MLAILNRDEFNDLHTHIKSQIYTKYYELKTINNIMLRIDTINTNVKYINAYNVIYNICSGCKIPFNNQIIYLHYIQYLSDKTDSIKMKHLLNIKKYNYICEGNRKNKNIINIFGMTFNMSILS